MLARTVLALSLVVRVYDNAGIAVGELESALAAARSILKEAGIAVTWGGQEGQDGQDLQNALIVRIVDAPPTSLPGSLGFSFVDVRRGAGTLATIFADRVHALSSQAGADSGQLLGRAIAHEIGHLLLGTTHHANRGLMRGVWTTIDLRNNQPWDWSLSRDDAARMRRGLAARLRRPQEPASVIAKK
jgi:hypothetical protein